MERVREKSRFVRPGSLTGGVLMMKATVCIVYCLISSSSLLIDSCKGLSLKTSDSAADAEGAKEDALIYSQPGIQVYRGTRRVAGGSFLEGGPNKNKKREEVAIKIVKNGQFAERAATESEARIHEEITALRHEHLLPLLDWSSTPEATTLVFPFIEGGDLKKKIGQAPLPAFEEKALKHLCREVASGLSAMHDAGICHHDLKPENILLEKRDDPLLPELTTLPEDDLRQYRAIVFDFGLSMKPEDVNWDVEQQKLRGTSGYYAPEMLSREKLDCKIDVFALGVILFHMAIREGTNLMVQELQKGTLDAIEGDFLETDELNTLKSPAGRELLKKMLRRDPKQRISAREILNSEWLLEGEPDVAPPTPQLRDASAAAAAVVVAAAELSQISVDTKHDISNGRTPSLHQQSEDGLQRVSEASTTPPALSTSDRSKQHESSTDAEDDAEFEKEEEIYAKVGIQVFRGTRRAGGGFLENGTNKKRKVAIKIVKNGAFATRDATEREAHIHEEITALGHENLLPLLDSSSTPEATTLVFPFIEGGDLAEQIGQPPYPNFDEKALKHLCREVASGLSAMHDAGICHHDLKPENILLQKKDDPLSGGTTSEAKDYLQQYRAIVFDFGLSVKEQDMAFEDLGSYRAPEQFLDEEKPNLDCKIDVFALGVILYEMATQQRQTMMSKFRQDDELQILDEMLQEDTTTLKSPAGKDLLKKMLERDPTQRISAREILKSEWLLGEEQKL